MGCEHERIHFETSSVLMRELPASLLSPPPQWPAYHASVQGGVAPPPNAMVTGGSWVLGWRVGGWPWCCVISAAAAAAAAAAHTCDS